MTSLHSVAYDTVPIYDRLAQSYDSLHHRWLKYAGGEAQAALEATVRTSISPGSRVLDVGCGTGAFARRLLTEGHRADHLTLLDPSPQMLRRCDDIPCCKVEGRLEALPFQDEEFDIVTCAWALEAAMNVGAALDEMCRVLRQDGYLLLAFCAERPSKGAIDWLLSRTLEYRGTGRFLSISGVTRLIEAQGDFQASSVPLAGPVAMVVARRSCNASGQ